MSFIPVVDFAPLSERNGRIPSEEDWNGVQKEIYKALSEVGFVYIINHGIEQEKIEESFNESKTFFESSRENKIKYKRESAGGCYGYSEPNQEKLSSSTSYELRESYDISKIVPNPSEFEKTLLELKNECTQIIVKILKLFARAVEEDEDYFVNLTQGIFDDNIPTYSTFRSLYYPKVPEDMKIEPGFVRCGEHTDYGTLTLLFQDGIGGLEVKTVHDTWVPAIPIPGSILVNTGDLLEHWTGGRFPATTHRVLIPENELKKRIPRQSIAYFVHPDNGSIVSPLKSAKSQDFEPMSAADHVKRKLNTTYAF